MIQRIATASPPSGPLFRTLPSTLPGTFGDLGFLSPAAGGRDSNTGAAVKHTFWCGRSRFFGADVHDPKGFSNQKTPKGGEKRGGQNLTRRAPWKTVSDPPHLGTFCPPPPIPFLLVSFLEFPEFPSPDHLRNHFSEGLRKRLPTGHPREVLIFRCVLPPPPP